MVASWLAAISEAWGLRARRDKPVAMARTKSATQPAEKAVGTKQRILEIATGLMQARGFHGFTFHDVAKALGVSHVAVHHHYKTKSDLVAAAMHAYTDRFACELGEIGASGKEPLAQLRDYAKLFEAVIDGGERVCLCGILAAEIATLPDAVKPEVMRFYEVSESWLAKVIAKVLDKRAGTVAVQHRARAFLAQLGGAMVSARAFRDAKRLSAAAELWIASLQE